MHRLSWESLGHRPAFFPVVALLVGVVVGPLTQVPASLFFIVFGASLGIAWWRDVKWGAWLCVLLAAAMLGAGVSAWQADANVPEVAVDGQRHQLTGTVERLVASDVGASATLHVTRVDEWTANFRATVTLLGPTSLLEGQAVTLRSKLRERLPAMNPGESSRFELLTRRAQEWSGVASSAAVVALSAPSRWQQWLHSSHRQLDALTQQVVPDRSAAALVMTLAAGERAELSEEAEDEFARSGLAHVLSVSGLHVAVLAFAVFRVLRGLMLRIPSRRLRRFDVRQLAAPAAIPWVWLYVAFTQWQPPAVRSAVMCSLLLLAHVFMRRSDGLNALSLAALVMVLLEPSSPFELSVQLSFVAVLALTLLAPALRSAIPLAVPTRKHHSRGAYLVRRAFETGLGTFLASLAVTVATAPITLAAFQRVGAAGLVSNIFMLPLCGALVLLCAAGAGLSLVSPPAALPFLWLAGKGSLVLMGAAEWFASLPFAAVSLPAMEPLVMFTFWAGLLAFALLHGRWRWLALAAPLAVVFHVVGGAQNADEVRVTFLSVGHGDAIVVSSGKHHALIDGGGVPDGADTGKRFVEPFLRARRISEFDLVALSHAHPDHALGLISTLRDFSTKRLWLPRGTQGGEGGLVDELEDAAEGAVIERVGIGHRSFTLGLAEFEVLGPSRELETQESENDRSMVLRLRHGSVSFLLTGDIEADGEAQLAPGAVTVMKAPHHGSRTSSTEGFLERTKPKYVVFCVGAKNRFGFPHRDVVARYTKLGARCLRTDLDGAVTFISNGTDVRVETFAPLQHAPLRARRSSNAR